MEGVFDVMKKECISRIRNIGVGQFYIVAMTLETDQAFIVERNEHEDLEDEPPLYWVFSLDMTKAVETDGQPLEMLLDLVNNPLPDHKKITLPELQGSRCPMTIRKRRFDGSPEAEVIARGETGDFYRFLLPWQDFFMENGPRQEHTFEIFGETFRYKTMSVAPIAVYDACYDN